MQTERLAELVTQVVKATCANELAVRIAEILPSGGASAGANAFNRVKTHFQATIFQAQAQVHALSKDSEVQALMSKLGVERVFDAQTISTLIFAFQSSSDAPNLWKNFHWMLEIVSFQAVLANLVKLDRVIRDFVTTPRLGVPDKSKTVLRFEVLDLKQDGFGFERLEEVLPKLQALFAEHCRVFDLEQSNTRIAFLDSGSGLTIGIKGDLKVVDSIRKLFVAVWDKIRFRKIEDFKEKLESIDASLDVLTHINEKEKSGVIDPHEASRLKHVILDNVVELMRTGTNLQELQKDDVIQNDAILLHLVVPKYLTGGSAADGVALPEGGGQTSESPSTDGN
jgi:hypothetical protein